MKETVHFSYFFFLRGVYISKKMCSIRLWAAELGWWELGNRLGLGGLELWDNYSFDLVYKLEKKMYFTSFGVPLVLSDIFSWKTLDRQMLVTSW